MTLQYVIMTPSSSARMSLPWLNKGLFYPSEKMCYWSHSSPRVPNDAYPDVWRLETVLADITDGLEARDNVGSNLQTSAVCFGAADVREHRGPSGLVMIRRDPMRMLIYMAAKKCACIDMECHQLSMAITRTNAEDVYLDFCTGQILSRRDCPKGECGEGFPGVRQTWRFIRIPRAAEFARQFAAWEHLVKVEKGLPAYDDIFVQMHPESRAQYEETRMRLYRRAHDFPRPQNLTPVSSDVVTQLVGMQWLRRLRPEVMIVLHSDTAVLSIYDPAVGAWIDGVNGQW